MKRGSKLSLILASSLVLLFIALLFGVRSMQDNFSPAEQVADTGFVRVRNGYVDVYATRVGPRVVVFDTGMDPDAGPVKEALRALDAGPEDVSHIMLTHGHVDHINGVNGLPPEITGALIMVGLLDTALLDGKRPNPRLIPRLLGLLLEAPRFSVTAGLKGPRRISVGPEAQVVAFPVPGHTAGSYAYFLNGVLIAGDAMNYRGGLLEPAPSFLSEDPERALESLVTLKKMLTHVRVRTVCTGHGGCTPEADTGRLLAALFSSAEAATGGGAAPPRMGAAQ